MAPRRSAKLSKVYPQEDLQDKSPSSRGARGGSSGPAMGTAGTWQSSDIYGSQGPFGLGEWQRLLLPPLHIDWQQGQKVGPGLKNLGNTCYLNSVLQCLTYTPPLANFCLQQNHSTTCTQINGPDASSNCPFCLLEKRIVRSLTLAASRDVPRSIVSRIKLIARTFTAGRQEDAHELLRLSLEACNKVCVEMHKKTRITQRGLEPARSDVDNITILKSSGSRGGASEKGQGKPEPEPHTIVKEIFGGVLQSQVRCMRCDAESNTRDDMMDLCLDVFQINSLKEALRRYTKPEILEGDNSYRCDRCKRLSVARKALTMLEAPNILVIQFKRFENIYGRKIDRHIMFNEHLSLADHMSENTKDPNPEYSLYGVVVHAGYSQDCGHYYAYVKDSYGSWSCCDDCSVSPVSPHEVLSDKAYLLFYRRTNTRPPPGTDSHAEIQTPASPSLCQSSRSSSVTGSTATSASASSSTCPSELAFEVAPASASGIAASARDIREVRASREYSGTELGESEGELVGTSDTEEQEGEEQEYEEADERGTGKKLQISQVLRRSKRQQRRGSLEPSGAFAGQPGRRVRDDRGRWQKVETPKETPGVPLRPRVKLKFKNSTIRTLTSGPQARREATPSEVAASSAAGARGPSSPEEIQSQTGNGHVASTPPIAAQVGSTSGAPDLSPGESEGCWNLQEVSSPVKPTEESKSGGGSRD